MHKHYWRSENELNQTAEFQSFQEREFPVDASILETPVSRRTFIKLMGASMALAGLTGCDSIRKPTRHIYPYANMPEYQIPGRPNFYATAMAIGRQVNGLVVESFEGRPTKIEGNPDFPTNPKGGASLLNQAAVLNLYDPERLKTVRHQESTTWDAFFAWWNRHAKTLQAHNGAGLFVLSDIQTGPTFYRIADQLKSTFPAATLLTSEPINADNQVEGIESVTGQKVLPWLDFSAAKVIVSLDGDFLGVEGDVVPQIRTFSESRVPGEGMSRFYAIESRTSVTGAKADHRLRVKPSQVEAFAVVLAKQLSQKVAHPGWAIFSPLFSAVDPTPFDAKFVDALTDDLLKNRGGAVIAAGYNQPASVHALVWTLNAALGNNGKGVRYYGIPFGDHSFNSRSSTAALITLQKALESKSVDTLVILGGDPVYTAPSDLNLGSRLALAKHVVHLTLRENATSQAAEWVLPEAHFLESWDDVTGTTGSSAIVQPLIQPLFGGKTRAELLSLLAGSPQEDYDLVSTTAKTGYHGSRFDADWKSWLHRGVVSSGTDGSALAFSPTHTVSAIVGDSQKRLTKTGKGLEVAFYPDLKMYDGRFVDNGWLQEIPDTATKLTWDNAVLISRKTADDLDLQTEDVVTLAVGSRHTEAAIFVLPGMPDETLALTLGYGQRYAGLIGANRGFNAYALRTSDRLTIASGVKVTKTGKKYPLSCTQDHWSMENRPLIREATLAEYMANPDFAREMGEEAPHNRSSWNEQPYDTGYQWGMFIDLAKCTGCNACTIACQAENNIPIVGKEEVKRGREMHWIRVDRYFVGETNEAQMAFQPVTCLQCENAPCENVCPVAATTHSTEGLNDMTYNRCVGTRYCSNNCPVKVRRFNFFDYHQRNPLAKPKERQSLFDAFKDPDKLMQMQFNPDVTVRMRGVMEKCTYCVQRINQGKFAAKLQNRTVQDGEIKTACQQTCPASAITFGNIRDENSVVFKMRQQSRNYSILESLLLKARTTYGASVTNPHDMLAVAANPAVEHGGHH